ncbi:pyruvate ferredoxin oxidoreductase subunit gamma [Candidatus Solincola tengchongensis]|uniref:pyruvate ferredoxin oxidoreductase subunit gamma n=1 Tax=Candidatus Solincola tengchongensis TaxID=2900693 RepID=UPI00257ECF95|nr:pyruvate ferredoxin oxidoreductase subunit gamma [Candidatus Solincola tengchongensis]
MEEIRIHGRGGMGNVTAAELLAEAAFADGKYAQAFPFFGAERQGAPVVAFVRIDDRPIRLRQQVYAPDHLIVQDVGLIYNAGVLEGLKPGGTVLVNTTRPGEELPVGEGFKVYTVPALKVALEVIGRPIINVVMVGAFACATGLVRLEAVTEAIRTRFPGELGEKEALATLKACEQIGECG